jgi:arsenate reductase (glutaredoxin)
MSMKLYGIPNCNTVKKARDWLAQHNIAVEFHDFKKHGLSADIAQNWLQQSDWQHLINRSGLTWRALPEANKHAVLDAASALALMLEKTSVIKRPLLERDGKLLHVGFSETDYERIFKLT